MARLWFIQTVISDQFNVRLWLDPGMVAELQIRIMTCAIHLLTHVPLIGRGGEAGINTIDLRFAASGRDTVGLFDLWQTSVAKVQRKIRLNNCALLVQPLG